MDHSPYLTCLVLGTFSKNCSFDRKKKLQDAAARLIMKIPQHSHKTPKLMELHQLSVHQCIEFKVLVTVFKSLPDLSPVYIKELLVRKPTSSRAMRSHDQNFLFVPVSHIATYGDQNFKRLAPDMWNKPPTEPRLCDEMEAFKIHLKSLLFKDAFY